MRCPICDTKEPNWKNVDQYRIKPVGMSLCQTCGFISYPNLYKEKSEIIEHYKNNYRGSPPSSVNIFQGERKCAYHMEFLRDLIVDWQKSDQKLMVTDVGAAFGLALDWFRRQFPKDKCEVTGVDLTPSFVRNAWHMFGIQLTEDFDDSREYDLIMSYKSHEHILDPDIELKRYLGALKPGGFLYYSVPLWFKELGNFGMQGFDVEYYYSTNHVNTWTKKHVEGLIKVCGGEVVKENHTYYGDTYLIKRAENPEEVSREICYEDPTYIEECLEKVAKVGKLLSTANLEKTNLNEAIEIWPNCPTSHKTRYEFFRSELHERGFEWINKNILEKAIQDCPESSEIRHFAADISFRYNAWDLAIKYLSESNQMCPNNPNIFNLLANINEAIAEQSSDPSEKVKSYEQAKNASIILRDLSRAHFADGANREMAINARIPTPWE